MYIIVADRNINKTEKFIYQLVNDDLFRSEGVYLGDRKMKKTE